MPKVSKIQNNFNAGEVAPTVYGRTDSERYDTALTTCLNYIPIVQGPLVRRAGTKYVGNVKDSTRPPALIPFNYSGLQSYVLEFGDSYIRFYANDGQILTNTTVFKVAGFDSASGSLFTFTATRSSGNPNPGETVTASSVLASGSVFELASPYLFGDVASVRWAQKEDTIYLVHPRYPPYKLQKQDTYSWVLKRVNFQDGPYLPLNSFSSIADSTRVTLIPTSTVGGNTFAGPINQISGVANNGAGVIRVTAPSHGRLTGDQVVIVGVQGTSEANNYTSSIPQMQWTINVIDSNNFDLFGSAFSNAYVGSGQVFSALFTPNILGGWLDPSRNVAFIQNGTRYWGNVLNVTDRRLGQVLLNANSLMPNTSVITTWQMGVWRAQTPAVTGFPGAVCFHQNRLFFSGTPGYPLEIDASQSGGNYEAFAASGSTLQVTDANALQFNLLSTQVSATYWMKSAAQGLLVGTTSGEWQIQPNTQAGALTPTNFSAQQVASFGSANVDSVEISNAVIYMQLANRRLREMTYFFQIGTFRSTNLSELSEHITLPFVSQLAVQKEAHPLVWGIRADGQLISLSYSRDDVSLKAGFARHQYGGQSDTAGTPPIIKSMAVAMASSALYQELWTTVQRSIAGSSVVTIEYMTRPFTDNALQEDAYYLDCGSTYDNPVPVFGFSTAGSAVVTALAHGFVNSSVVQFKTAYGLNSSVVDADGNVTVNNLINNNTFVVASASTNTFFIQDFSGNYINSQTYTSYLGSAVVRKLVTTISGLTWLSGDTVGVLADGGIHPPCVVSSSGSITLSFPAAKVQVGYPYNSDAQMLRTKDGSAQGTSIGSTRRVNRVAFMLHNVAELSVGPSFTKLLPIEFPRADVQRADSPTQIQDGIFREFVAGGYTFDDDIAFRQSAPLPGTIQAVVRFLEENDV